MPDTAAPEEDEIVSDFLEKRHEFKVWKSNVLTFLGDHPILRNGEHPFIHSVKSRVKDEDHLRDKLRRKASDGEIIGRADFFRKITDLAGVRVLHLFQQDFGEIDRIIRAQVDGGDWYLDERPKAYTWDPENVTYFSEFDLDVMKKDSAYTSVHYLIRPRSDSLLCCEVQVRTLFEEIWGEVDHQINYPHPNDSVSLREQLKVLSKITGAGSRLLDAIARVRAAE